MTQPLPPAATKRQPAKRAAASSAITAVKDAKERASIPSRPVIEHTKLLRATLQVERKATNDALAAVDLEMEVEAGARDAAIEAADRAYDLAMEAAFNAREGTHALANERHNAIRAQLDEERNDLIRKLDGIEAALTATEAKPTASNVEPIRSAVEMAA